MVKLSFKDLAEAITGEKTEFPKYTTWIINQVNRISQATRPKVVGQMSDLIQDCPYKSFEGWKKWYKETHPDAVKNATKKISDKFKEVKEAFDSVDYGLIEKWVEDLVIVKTFLGLRVQEAILKKIAKMGKKKYRLSKPEEESKGIDGFIGNVPVSIKPKTYKLMKHLQDKIDVVIITYEKKGDGIVISYSQIKKLLKSG